MTKTGSLDELQNLAIKELVDFFQGTKAARSSKTAITASNLAVKSLGAVGRIKATDRARDATQLSLLKVIAKDKREFKKYISVSMPHLNPAKQIEG